VSGDAGGYVAVWKAATGELLTLGHKHELYVNQIRLGKDGTIYSAGDDDVVRGYACGSCADSTDDLIAMARNQLRWLRRPSPILPVLTVGAEIATGTCTTDPGSDFTRAQPVACTEPHAYEFFAAFELPDPVDADYPGGPELQDRTDRLCGERAITLGDAIPAGLIVSSYKSDEKAWEADARHVQCVFQLESGGEWVGSVLEGTATVPRG
jgi:hypothetical protein